MCAVPSSTRIPSAAPRAAVVCAVAALPAHRRHPPSLARPPPPLPPPHTPPTPPFPPPSPSRCPPPFSPAHTLARGAAPPPASPARAAMDDGAAAHHGAAAAGGGGAGGGGDAAPLPNGGDTAEVPHSNGDGGNGDAVAACAATAAPLPSAPGLPRLPAVDAVGLDAYVRVLGGRRVIRKVRVDGRWVGTVSGIGVFCFFFSAPQWGVCRGVWVEMAAATGGRLGRKRRGWEALGWNGSWRGGGRRAVRVSGGGVVMRARAVPGGGHTAPTAVDGGGERGSVPAARLTRGPCSVLGDPPVGRVVCGLLPFFPAVTL